MRINKMIDNFVLHFLIIVVIVSGNKHSDTLDAEIDQVLKKLNKPAIKSIKSPDGDIIDCIHMKNHPIYDHHLLKNHTIQMRPSFFPRGWDTESSFTRKQNTVIQLWTLNGKCPKNSIPIRRTRKEDILRVKSIENYEKKDPNNIRQYKSGNSTNNNVNEYAVMKVTGKFHGAKAVINVWKPYVQSPREFSQAKMIIRAGSQNELNTIEAGWQVYQSHYSDDSLRYFIYRTVDGYRSGCFDLECSDFIQITQEFALGAVVGNYSTLNGTQYDFSVQIWKDVYTGDWWVRAFDHITVGYWPSRLFTHLQEGATEIVWGGEISNLRLGLQHTTTKMGSGHFAEEGYKKASFFRNLEIVDEHGIIKRPEEGQTYMSKESCYNIIPNYAHNWGRYFFYGGPGRNQNCII